SAPSPSAGPSLSPAGVVHLRNRRAYTPRRLGTGPTQSEPLRHHESWTRAPTYSASTTWPAYALITACPQELLAYVEAKAIVGGTTTIQGSPPKSKPRDGGLVRNVEDETFGTGDRNLVYAATLPLKPPVLADRANKMRAGASFIYHCAEGQRDSIVAQEYLDADHAGCLAARFIGVHLNAINPAWLADWAEP